MFSYILSNVKTFLSKVFDETYDLAGRSVVPDNNNDINDDINDDNDNNNVIPLSCFTWTVEHHAIFLICLIEGHVGICDQKHPIFGDNCSSWREFTEMFRDLMIEYNLYTEETKLLFERPDKGYINGRQILQSRYSDIKKERASEEQKRQCEQTHEIMLYNNRLYLE